MDRLARLIKNPLLIIRILGYHGYLNFIPDKAYLKLIYRISLHKPLNLHNPKSFSEKIQWLKLYDHNMLYPLFVDKYAVKQYVADKIGAEHIIPTLGVWNTFDGIDFETLPQRFILKCTHDSASFILCHDKKTLNLPALKRKLEKHLKQDYAKLSREWPYAKVKHRIIAEPMLTDSTGELPQDWKLLCFNGKVKVVYTVSHRETDPRNDYFDENFNHLPFENIHPKSADSELPQRPAALCEMIQIAEILSQGIAQVRVDLYYVNHTVYFGELTLYHAAGFSVFKPEEWDRKLGEWLDISKTEIPSPQ